MKLQVEEEEERRSQKLEMRLEEQKGHLERTEFELAKAQSGFIEVMRELCRFQHKF